MRSNCHKTIIEHRTSNINPFNIKHKKLTLLEHRVSDHSIEQTNYHELMCRINDNLSIHGNLDLNA
jgi:hypothetical protein